MNDRQTIRFEFDPQSDNKVILIGTTKNRQAVRLPRPMTRREVNAAINGMTRGFCEPARKIAERVKMRIDSREFFAWHHAVVDQCFTGDFHDWLALDAEARAEYEAGAAGVGTE